MPRLTEKQAAKFVDTYLVDNPEGLAMFARELSPFLVAQIIAEIRKAPDFAIGFVRGKKTITLRRDQPIVTGWDYCVGCGEKVEFDS